MVGGEEEEGERGLVNLAAKEEKVLVNGARVARFKAKIMTIKVLLTHSLTPETHELILTLYIKACLLKIPGPSRAEHLSRIRSSSHFLHSRQGTSEELQNILYRIDGSNYKAYFDIKGTQKYALLHRPAFFVPNLVQHHN